MQLLYKLPVPVTAGNETARIRVAITAFFAADGFIFASWAVRIPAVKAAVGASPQALGLALLGVSLGAIATMTLTGALCRRFGSPRVAVVAAVWLSFALLLPALSRSALALALSLVVFGIGYGGLNVAMNSYAVDLVAVMRRPVMPSFHAAWSFGGLAGAALGGLAAPHLSPLTHFALVGLLGLAVTATCGRIIVRSDLPGQLADRALAEASAIEATGGVDPGSVTGGSGGTAGDGGSLVEAGTAGDGGAMPRKATTDDSQPNGSVPRPAASPGSQGVWRTVILLGVIALCSTYGEGAVSDWGALHLRNDLKVDAGLAAAGYAAFALAEAGGRLFGTALLDRLGQTRVLVYGGLITCAGMLAAALSPALPLSLLGFALAGLGVANAFPTAMSRVGALAGPNGVAAASTFGYAGFLLGPPAIGFLTGAVSLRVALTTVSVLGILAVVLARAASADRTVA
ncbi:MAG TPA: MFS transporter [Trebonia sp.]|nr:MFS transporter [Trebonia sp.]